ncbi:hypothetical protein GCM10010428_50670 [Actinosynnema pretiosum subsp. pretiosum]
MAAGEVVQSVAGLENVGGVVESELVLCDADACGTEPSSVAQAGPLFAAVPAADRDAVGAWVRRSART